MNQSISLRWQYWPALWLPLVAWVCIFQGAPFVQSLRIERNQPSDFLQDWASAREFLEGQPIYGSQKDAVRRQLGLYVVPADEASFNATNAHPPTSVLLFLPLAVLDYPDAFLLWNLLSLLCLAISFVLVVRELPYPLES